jgi:hypothetical protein
MKEHPYKKEVELIKTKLEEHNFEFSDPKKEDFVETVLSMDEHQCEVKKDGKHYGILIVLGNEPGIAICNYTVHPELDEISSEVYAELAEE